MLAAGGLKRTAGIAPWLVRYERKGSQLLRRAYLCARPPPHPHAQPQTWRAQQRTTEAGSDAPYEAIIEVYDTADNSFVSRMRQAAAHVRVLARIVDCAVSDCGSQLLVVLAVPPAPGDDSSCRYFRFQPISLSTWAAELPFVDVFDWSRGLAAPVYCIRCGQHLLLRHMKCGLLPTCMCFSFGERAVSAG